MVELIIIRTYFKDATIGLLSINGKEICNTLELPWENNSKTISCIPEGEYIAYPEHHKKHGYCIRIPKVKNRSGILIHKGNELVHTKGCILVGMFPLRFKAPYYLKDSAKKMAEIFTKCDFHPIKLIIAEDLNLPTNQNTNYE